eukprot:350197-Chlamydomonas_euryale.AAC.6
MAHGLGALLPVPAAYYVYPGQLPKESTAFTQIENYPLHPVRAPHTNRPRACAQCRCIALTPVEQGSCWLWACRSMVPAPPLPPASEAAPSWRANISHSKNCKKESLHVSRRRLSTLRHGRKLRMCTAAAAVAAMPDVTLDMMPALTLLRMPPLLRRRGRWPPTPSQRPASLSVAVRHRPCGPNPVAQAARVQWPRESTAEIRGRMRPV